MPRLRICIDARLIPGTAGGIEQVVIGLAHGLATLGDTEQEYFFLTYQGVDDWITPYLSPRDQLLRVAPPQLAYSSWKARLKRAAPWGGKLYARLRHCVSGPPIPASDGTIEHAGIHVMHFTHQSAFRTAVPSIYHPHDLQHLHLPAFFSPFVYAAREATYRMSCSEARFVCVASDWVKEDLVAQYGLPPDKVEVIPLAPVLDAYPQPSTHDLQRVRQQYGLPPEFALYPAQTWQHKNHLGLIEAIAALRDRSALAVSLVCSGRKNDFFPAIQQRVRELGLESLVHFPGFVSPLDLNCLYRLAKCVVVPTKFEAASFPVWEAFLARCPVACSNVTSLPEQVGDAALLFDPNDVDGIADCVYRIWTSDELRTELVTRAVRNVSRNTWLQVATRFRNLYRKTADPVSAE